MTIVVTNIAQIAHYQGEHAIDGLRFRPVRQAMGVSAWGMNVLEFDAACEGYPDHDHAADGQEEVYLVLDGSLVLVAEGVEHVLTRGDMVRVPAHTVRKFVTRGETATLLALGSTPGAAYAPDPRMATT
jgi:uncharacterized cupin superfamily protein